MNWVECTLHDGRNVLISGIFFAGGLSKASDAPEYKLDWLKAVNMPVSSSVTSENMYMKPMSYQ